MDGFFKSLESVLNISPTQAKTLVSEFNNGDLEFFQTYFLSLPTVKLQTSSVLDISANTTVFIQEDHIGEGGFGTVYRNRERPYVYKIVEDYKRVNNKNSLQYLKTNFKEAIIQSLLQSDASYGKYVCRLYKVFRDGNNFVFQLEPLDTTLDKYIYENRAEEHLPELVERVLFKMITILNHFFIKYGFNQGDAGGSNIMTANKADFVENLRIIDFGVSTISLFPVGKPTKKHTDTKNLYAILEYRLREEKRKLFGKLVRLPPETPVQQLKDVLNSKKRGGLRRTRKLRN